MPLAPAFPLVELRHIINDSGAAVLISSVNLAAKAKEVLGDGVQHSLCSYQLAECHPNASEANSSNLTNVTLSDFSEANLSGMMLYTSGTTARPKGVMLSDSTLVAQAQSLLTAWHYQPSDHLLHVLPLHHIHGTVNALLTPLLVGSTVEFMYPFDAKAVWTRLASPFLQEDRDDNHIKCTSSARSNSVIHDQTTPISLFTAVPTVWARMLQAHALLEPDLQRASKNAIRRETLRLNMSGSAALPKSISEGWTTLSGGNILLERYGMTEVGMALSCGLSDADRVESSVGWPLPSVQARLMEKDAAGVERLIALGEEIDPSSNKERQGEIQLRGPTIFKGYWQNPVATAKEFTEDGWFRTGDIAIRRHVSGAGESGSWASGPAYFIQGRQSADIIKTGGEKVSALEIEREILALPQVSECAVVGLPSESWGQKVAAVIVLSQKSGYEPWGLAEMRRELKTRLVPYKIPQDLEVVDEIKRNAMGKVNKKELVPMVFGDGNAVRRRSVDLRNARSVGKK